MSKLQTTTRNEKFNGYNYGTVNSEKDFYASQTSTTTSQIKKITKTSYSNIKLLNVYDSVVVTGQDIIADAANNRTLRDMGYKVKIDYSEKLDKNKNYYIFGTPYQKILANRQNYNNCGVESCLNTLITAGKISIKNEKKTEKSFLKKILSLGLCDDDNKIGVLDGNDGGTLPFHYKEILSLYGIESEAYYTETDGNIELSGSQYTDDGLKNLGYKISQGYGAIVGVCSGILWQEQISETGEKDIDHAVAIIGVLYDTNTPNENTAPTGFFIQDTGAWMTRFITTEELLEATLYDEYCNGLTPDDENYNRGLYGKTGKGLFITITTASIKDSANNLNATGDKYANTILGNSGNNVIKGMSGNDILYGGAGDDTIYGGDGNDIIYGNGGISTDSYMYEMTAPDDEKKLTGKNKLNGGKGNDIIYGGNYTDIIYAGEGHDTIYANEGIDVIYGGKGNDEIHGGLGGDKILGESGNDIIYGDDGDDTINAGAGNDKIYGGFGNDRIECGKGNDTVIFENKNHGFDIIYALSGKTNIKYTANNISINDLYFDLERDEENSNIRHLDIAYTDNKDEIKDGIIFNNFFNSKKNTNKNITIEDCNGEKYCVSATKSTKAVVANTSTKKGNKKINNILFSTNLKNTTIKTSTKNDIVYIMETTKDLYIAKEFNKYDKITYTGGNDKYYSRMGNTSYTVKFNEKSNLNIYDNIDLIEKKYFDNETLEITDYTVPASSSDEIKFTIGIDSISFLFDVSTDKKVSKNTQFYALFNDDNLYDRITGLISGETVNGIVTMNEFFKKDSIFEATNGNYNFYGNGNIESVYTKEDTGYMLYENMSADIVAIASNVASWLDGKEYSSAFDAIDKITDTNVLESLIQCYTSV